LAGTRKFHSALSAKATGRAVSTQTDAAGKYRRCTMRVTIEESDFVVSMYHVGSESTHRLGLYTPDIVTILQDYVIPCIVSLGFSHKTIHDAMGELASEAEEMQSLPPGIQPDEYPEYRVLSGMCGREGSAGQDKGKPEAEA
jgi:hypothetical protein